MKRIVFKIAGLLGLTAISKKVNDETSLLATGKLLSNQQKILDSLDINDFEFKIFSQWGDDGIIQYLIKHVNIQNKIFIEFGVENYMESNTRFLMMNDNWKGLILDGSEENMENLKKRDWFWKYDLTCRVAFIDKENVNTLLSLDGFSNIGLLHIDIDGNDYHILEALDLSSLNPSILIMEYNAVLGNERSITIPYKRDFIRGKAHYSNLYYGASLPALTFLASKKGYALIGCNMAGNNAYFIKKELLNHRIKEISVQSAFRTSHFRESRAADNSLSLLSGKERINEICGLEVLNVISGKVEKL